MAPKQSRFMGMFDDSASDKVTQAINNKGEIYRLDLYPDQTVAKQAQSDFDGFRTGTPAIEQIGQDMRRFYGFGTPAAPTAAAIAPRVTASPVTTVREVPQPKQEPYPMQGPNPMQGPKEAKAQQLKEDTVNKILGYDLQKMYDQIKNTKGLFTDSALTEAAIAGGSVLGLTGIAGLGGADGGDAIGGALLGSGLAAAPAIFNEVRDPKYRTGRANSRDLVGLIAASAGAGAGTSMLMDALGLTNQG